MVFESAKERFFFDVASVQMVSSMRALLAVATLFTVFIDPSEPSRLVFLTYTALVAYSIYSLTLYYFSKRKIKLFPIKISHWIDVVWYLFLIALSAGTSSIFFFLLFFAVLTASFRFGFREGIRVTVFSAVMFSLVGYLTAPSGEQFELNRTLLRPVYLCVFGYMMSYLGGEELKYKKRLAVLRDINRLYNPRFGVDQTMSALMRQITAAFDADTCRLISNSDNTSECVIRESYRENPEQALRAKVIEKDHPIIKIPSENAVIYHNLKKSLISNVTDYQVFDLEGNKLAKEPLRNGEFLADLLDTNSFMSIALYPRGSTFWRVYVTSRTKIFDHSDVEFLQQLLEQALSVVENVNLLDHLASEATEQQRQKISRDIHDSTIQPYIGIKLGLEALQIKYGGSDGINDDLNQLINLAETNIRDIRSYVKRLKSNTPNAKTGNVLVSAIRQQAKKISEFYGIRIDVLAEDDLININDRLSAEVFQIVTESLSNIKRHTNANQAAISIDCDGKSLKLKVQNNSPNGVKPIDFVPKSIDGRAKAVGGRAFVENNNSHTTISVEIPL